MKRIRRAIETYLETYNRHLHGEEYLCVEFGKGHGDRCDWYVVPNDGAVSSSLAYASRTELGSEWRVGVRRLLRAIAPNRVIRYRLSPGFPAASSFRGTTHES